MRTSVLSKERFKAQGQTLWGKPWGSDLASKVRFAWEKGESRVILGSFDSQINASEKVKLGGNGKVPCPASWCPPQTPRIFCSLGMTTVFKVKLSVLFLNHSLEYLWNLETSYNLCAHSMAEERGVIFWFTWKATLKTRLHSVTEVI